MSNASGSQILTCTGQLKVDIGTSQNVANQGAVKFTGRLPSGKEIEYGGMKVYGYSGFGYLLLESLPTNLQNGFNIRTVAAQGGTEIGGSGEPFVFQALGEVCKMRNVEIKQPTSQTVKQYAAPVLSCIRNSTKDSLTTYYSPITQLTQSEFKNSEGIFYGVGNDGFNNVFYGVISPDGSSSSINNFGSIGIQRGSSTYYESIRFDINQNVTIPESLTANTISATTYLNLPAVPAGDLLPLTLDKTNNFVGINNLTPSEVLDVTGNAKVSGSIAVGSGGTTITSSSSSPEGTVSAPVGSLYMRTDGSTGTSVYVKESGSGNTGWNTLTGAQGPVGPVGPQGPQGPAGTPGITDLLPLTLDKVNNRVGINKTIPTEALDVVGSVATDTSVAVNGTLVLSGTATPEGLKTAPVGSLYLRKDGSAGTCLYVKESGTGNTGWNTITSGGTPPSWSVFKVGMSNQTGTITYNTDVCAPSNCTVNKGAGTVTITVAGRYNISFHGFKTWNEGQSDVQIMVNTTQKARGHTGWTSAGYWTMSVSVNVDLVVGDVVYIAWNGIEAEGNANCYFSGKCLVAYTAPAPSTELKCYWSVYSLGMPDQGPGDIKYDTDAVTPSNCTVNKSAGTVTITVQGNYRISFNATKVGSSGYTNAQLFVNGVLKARSFTGPVSYSTVSFDVILSLNANDILKISTVNSSDSLHGIASNFFTGHKI